MFMLKNAEYLNFTMNSHQNFKTMDNRLYRFNIERFRKVLNNFAGRFASQSHRAEVLGISQSSMSRLDNGKRQPTIEELLTICHRSGYSPADFFEVKE